MLYRGESIDVISEIITSRPDLKRDALLWEATRRFGEMYEEMFLRWLKETIAMVESNFK